MSRRTKLLIAALFLVLLGIPAVYAILTWRPENPLRFRLGTLHRSPESLADRQSHRRHGPRTRVSVVVENTSAVPIYMLSMWNSDDGDEGELRNYRPDTFTPVQNARKRRQAWLLISAHSSIEPPCTMDAKSIAPAEQGTLSMHYLWYSSTRYRVANACHWLYERSPASLQPIIPFLAMDMDAAPLAPPSLKP